MSDKTRKSLPNPPPKPSPGKSSREGLKESKVPSLKNPPPPPPPPKKNK